MEQINAGILSLMQIPKGAQMNGTKTDFGADRGEQTFDALLEQKTNQNRAEAGSDLERKPASSVKDKDQEEVRTENTTVSEKDENEESCDVAREAACAQIVWLMGQNNQDILVPEQEKVATIEPPMVIVTNDEPVEESIREKLDLLVFGPKPEEEEKPVIELTPASERELTPNLKPENMEETAPSQTETNTNKQEAEKPAEDVIDLSKDPDERYTDAAVRESLLFRDVEAPPIKVADAPAKTNASAPVEKQVTDKLVTVLESGENRVEIQLEPVELGKLTIELTRTEDGTLNILLSAENAQTRSLLERHVGTLQEALTDRGQQSVQITVDRNEESQRQDNQQQNDFQNGSNGRNSDQQRRDDAQSGEDFLQQLRLGLIPVEDEEND